MLQVHAPSPSRPARAPSPERWQRAAERALAEHIEVRQVNASGMWVASSGTQANVAYVLEIAGGFVQSCSCPAGTFGDPCCKHAARYYLDTGLLALDDAEPDPPAVGATIPCWHCSGGGVIYVPDCARAGWPHPECPVCRGSSELPIISLHDHPTVTPHAA
jgi:hypothetical protein